ncbi:MAG: serine hydrolase [Bacteroidetes bacterium]|nr:serine hydrolase [Bacteroidota bacterium]
MIKPILLFLLLSIASISVAQTTTEPARSIDSLVAPQFGGNQPGISILIAKKGQIIYQKAFGSADIELNVPMQPNDIFKIGSITKQFTAVAILQLAEQGKLRLDDPIQKYIPDYPDKQGTITIENLLTHTSGIVDYSSLDDPDPFAERRDFTPEIIINYFKKLPLQFEPGTKYAYSNSNYTLLGYIIQKVSGEDYHKYLDEHIIKPAGLQHTLYAPENVIVPGLVNGYTRDKGYFEHSYYQTLSVGFACGDLLSNTADLYQWNNALLAGKVISKASLDKAFTPYKLANGTSTGYGYGWFIDQNYGTTCIHHEGQTSGFVALEKYFPDEDIYIAILTNVKSGEDKTDFSDNRFRLFEKIGKLVLGRPMDNEVAVSDSILNKYAGTYSATFKKNQTMTIHKKEGKLYMDLSNGTGKNLLMVPLSETLFLLPDIKSIRTTGEFIIENGKVTKLIATQGKKYEWTKIK